VLMRVLEKASIPYMDFDVAKLRAR
jgi:hypothetical protein